MSNSKAAKYGGAFIDVLFIRLRSDNLKKMTTAGKILVYIAALVFYYLPILYFAVKKCLEYKNFGAYAVIILLIHILARIMLCGSKRIQRRFATIKGRRHFLMRTWLVLEYVVFMWVVYLFYPLVCVLVPLSVLVMSFENMLGFNVIFELFMHSSEMYLLVGGMISYVLFIVADGYRKLREGFLPDYLGLFVVLTIVSNAVGRVSQRIVDFISLDVSQLAGTLSWIFSVSNNAMNIVASVMALLFAIRSLYKNCGAEAEPQPDSLSEPPALFDAALPDSPEYKPSGEVKSE